MNLRTGDAELLDALIDQVSSEEASRAFPPPRILVSGHSLSTSAALLGHLALLLEAREQLGALRPEHARLRAALVEWLSSRVLAERGHLLATDAEHIYPADDEVLLAALTLATRRGDVHAARAADALRATLDALAVNGLTPSRLGAATIRPTDVPRGCALAYSAVFRALSGDPRAEARYASFRAAFVQTQGPFLGFREWPRGVRRSADVDSGPIVLGVGASASAFGLAAARLVSPDDFARLERTGRLARLLVRGTKLRDLSEAIWWFAVTARRW